MRTRLTYANIVSSAALFLALGGGAVYAAERIGSKDITARAVTSPKLDRNAVKPNKIAPKAIKRGKIDLGAINQSRIAESAVGGEQIADSAVGSGQILNGSVAPSDLEFPTQIVASPTGGEQPLTQGGPTSYPLANNTWTQRAGELDVVFGSLFATLAYDGGGSGQCSVNVSIVQNGQQVGGGFLQTSSTTPMQVAGQSGAAPGADPDTPTGQAIKLELFVDGCTASSQIDRAKFRVLGFGG